MNEFILYLLKVSLGIIVFYIVYWATLRKETLFKANRLFLVSSLIISLVLPFIGFTYTTHISSSETGNVFVELNKNIHSLSGYQTPADKSNSGFSWQNVLLIIYLTGFVIFTARLIWQCADLAVIAIKNSIRKVNGLKVVENNKYGLPFSFFSLVFINPNFHTGTDLTNILAHEKVHIRENHWFDLFIIELFTAVFWFNPFVWLFERSIKQNHEYLADEGVLAQGLSVGQYQAILLNQLMGMQIIGITNNLNYSLNKKRMKMMTKMKTPRIRAYKMLWALPATALILLAFAKPAYEVAPKNNTNDAESAIQEVRDINVQGKVVNEKGMPLEGASIIIGGTTIGTVSDKNGSFSINLSKTDKLYISYIGYVTLIDDITLIEKNDKINGIYKPIFNMKVGVIELEINQMLKEKPQPDVKEESTSTSKTSEEEELFVIVEQRPEYPGGMYALAQEIKEKTSKLKLSGKIEINFTVNEKGINTDIYILGKDVKNVEEDLVKFFLERKKWSPGKQRDKAVPVSYKIIFNK